MLVGCMTGRGSSIETLGLPDVEDRPGRPALVVGWAYEDRSGWIVKNVRLDGESRPEWDERTERPVVMYLTAGTHTLQLSTAQLRDPSDRSSRSRRRYQTRPVEIELEDGYSQICVVRLEGEERRRPVVRCESREILGEEDEASYEDEDEDEDGEYEDENGDQPEPPEERVAAVEAAPAPAPGAPQGGGDEAVPDPFAGPAAPGSAEPPRQPTAPASQAPAAPAAAAVRPPPPPPPAAVAPPPPRPLSLEERVERLERQLEELRRQIGPR
jgi:hypothetical protein